MKKWLNRVSLNAKFEFFSPINHLEFVISTPDVSLILQGGSEWKKWLYRVSLNAKLEFFSSSNHLKFVDLWYTRCLSKFTEWFQMKKWLYRVSLNAKFEFFSPSNHLEFVISTSDVFLSLQGGSKWKNDITGCL